ncbi:MAG: M14 family zinc carboxypeptidase, partial [Acidobacteriota bacterium]
MSRQLPCRSVFMLTLAVCVHGVTALAAADVDVPVAWAEVSADGPWVVRVPAGTPREVGWLSEQIDVWGFDPDERELVASVDADNLEFLRARGLIARIDAERTRELVRAGLPLEGQGGGIPGFPCYRTVEETFASARAMVAAHPDLATWIDVGDSWAKTTDAAAGYDLFVLELTQSSVPGPKPVFFASFAIHAREYATAELGTRFAEFLVDGYGSDPDVTWLLDEHEVHLMLQANPDGRKEAEAGAAWRKNTNNDFCSNTDLRG